MPRAIKISLITSAVLALLLLSAFGLLSLINSRTFQVFGGLTSHIQTQRKVVALTFDDGPTPGHTEEILSILAAEKVTATFMLTGEEMHKNPDEAKKIADAGHQIGNHSYAHQRMALKPMSFYRDEIEKTDTEIRTAGYTKEIIFRPPFGKKLFGLPYYLATHHRKTVTWDVEPESYVNADAGSDTIVQYTVDHTRPGSIILLHGMYATGQKTRDAIGPIIQRLKAKGYDFVSVSDLLEQK